MNSGQVAAILARHGIGADADPAALVAALGVRGWRFVTEEGRPVSRSPRWHAVAWRTVPGSASGIPFRQTLRAIKPTEAAALAELLAKALEREP